MSVFTAVCGYAAQSPVVAFEGCTLIDGNGEAPLAAATVAVQGKTILYAGPARDFKAPDGARRIDAKGKWILPGLFDMHTHVDDPELIEVKPTSKEKAQWLPLFVLHGVTGIREMAGDLALMQGFREKIAAGSLLGPRIWCGGPLVDGPQPMWPESIAISNAEEARRAVRDLKARGADFVKVYSLLSKESFLALCDESKRQGMAVCGHVPRSVSNLEAAEAGLNSIEHLLQLDRELADPEKAAAARGAVPADLDRFARFRANQEISERCLSLERAGALFGRFKELGVWIAPTLIVAYQNSHFEAGDKEMTRRLAYVPAYVREWWDPAKNVHLRSQSPDVKLGQQATYRVYQRLIPALKKAGIPLMAGSDMGGNPHCFAGWGVHDEMAKLVEAGLRPMDAIVAASSNLAKYLKVFSQVGSVEKGKEADLLVIDENPLADIRNTLKIDTVVVDGRVLDRVELDKRLEAQRREVATRLNGD